MVAGAFSLEDFESEVFQCKNCGCEEDNEDFEPEKFKETIKNLQDSFDQWENENEQPRKKRNQNKSRSN